MKIREIMLENNDDFRYVKSKNLPSSMNGGRIDIIVNLSNNNTINSYS